MVNESDVFGGVGDDSDDFLWALNNADLPGRDLNLGVWKLLAVAALSFGSVAALHGYLVQAAR